MGIDASLGQTTATDFDLIEALLPSGWQDKARDLGALRRGRSIADARTLLRVMMIHIAEGCGLRDTAERCDQCDVARRTAASLEPGKASRHQGDRSEERCKATLRRVDHSPRDPGHPEADEQHQCETRSQRSTVQKHRAARGDGPGAMGRASRRGFPGRPAPDG